MRNPTFKGFMSGHFSKQTVYDFVKAKLLEQGRVSVAPEGGCAYHGVNDAKCAVGWLIPDSSYHPDMEGDMMSLFYHCGIDSHKNDRTLEKYEFLSQMQESHDNLNNDNVATKAKFQKALTLEFEILAKSYKLKA